MSEVRRSSDLFRRRNGTSVMLVLASWGNNEFRGHANSSGVLCDGLAREKYIFVIRLS